jgi:Asp-tRNA(Asn)/Glu-tRNA(Gln) amidotransferase A subunit family amidase
LRQHRQLCQQLVSRYCCYARFFSAGRARHDIIANSDPHQRRIPGISSGGSAAAVRPMRAAQSAGRRHGAGSSISSPRGAAFPTRRTQESIGTAWRPSTSSRVRCAIALEIAPLPERPFLAEVTADPAVLRVGFTAEGPKGMPFEEETRASILRIARALDDLGHQVKEASPTWDSALMGEARTARQFGDLADQLANRS